MSLKTRKKFRRRKGQGRGGGGGGGGVTFFEYCLLIRADLIHY